MRFSLELCFLPGLLLPSGTVVAQQQEWVHFYSKLGSVRALADDGDHLWFVAGALTRLTKASGLSVSFERGTPDYPLARPYSEITSLLVDKDGSVWVGLDNDMYRWNNGLARFDGAHWEVDLAPFSALSANRVLQLTEDGSGNIWMAAGTKTIDRECKLVRFDGVDWTAFDSQNSGLPPKIVVSALEVDDAGHVWIGTQDAGSYYNNVGLIEFDPDSMTWTVYDTTNSGLPHNSVSDLEIDENGAMWVGTEGGLAKLEGQLWTVYRTENSGLPLDDVRSLAVDQAGNVWVGTEGAGVARFDGTTWTNYRCTNSPLPSDWIESILVDAAGSVWISTGVRWMEGEWVGEGGLVEFDGQNWKTHTAGHMVLPREDITTVQPDRLGNIWIGTLGGGAMKFDWKVWSLYTKESSGLPSDTVFTIAQDPLDNMWFGTAHGLVVYDGSRWRVYTSANSGLPANTVRAIAHEKSGNAYVGTWGGGLAKFDGVMWTVYNRQNSGLPSDSVSLLVVDDSGNLWASVKYEWFGLGLYAYWALDGKGLIRFDGSAWTVYDTTNSDLPSDVVTALSLDRSGNLWVGGFGHVTRFDGAQWTTITSPAWYTLIGWVTGIAIDAAGGVWFGDGMYTVGDESRGAGLKRLCGLGDTTLTWWDSGLLSNIIYGLKLDANENLWIMHVGPSDYGLSVYQQGGIVYTQESIQSIPARFALYQNYPNPFNPSTTIRYDLPTRAHVVLEIYNVLGEEVATLIDEEKEAGGYEATWNAGRFASGVYFYQLRAGEFTETKKLAFVR